MKKLVLLFIAGFFASDMINAQCETWIGKVNEEDSKSDHSIYRQSLRIKDYDLAYEYWSKVFAAAPAADGNRDSHFWDGIEIYNWKLGKEKDETKKKEIKVKILSIFDQMAECFLAGAISLRNCISDECHTQKAGFVYGRKAFEMYHNLGSPYPEIYENLKKSVDLAGLSAEYIVLDPLGVVMSDLYVKGTLDVDEVREYIIKIHDIAEYNIENDNQFSEYWLHALEKFDYDLHAVFREVFECSFFTKKLTPLFEENKENREVLQYILVTLKKQDCPEDDPFMMKVDEAWKKYADEYNMALRDSLEIANPALAASRLTNEGNYTGAAEKYQEAIATETDPERKANYLFALASIQFAELNQYSQARSNALEAASLKSNWGRPYILIGDMYSKSSRSCGDGDDWTTRLVILAALEKYYYARSIDPESADQANSRISRLESARPKREDGFMRGLHENAVINTGCWVAENVRLRFSD